MLMLNTFINFHGYVILDIFMASHSPAFLQSNFLLTLEMKELVE